MIIDLENILKNLTNRKYCLFLSRGATALFLTYKALAYLNRDKKRLKKIIIPSTLCHSPANVAISAGLTPIFCDVTLDNYTLCPIDLKKKLEDNEGVIAVLVASTFGHIPKMKQIYKICQEFDVKLIDDSAQSIGANFDNISMGKWGEVGILSFGHTKTIDVGGGAALLTDNFDLYNYCKNLYKTLKYKDAKILNLQNQYSSIYYEIEKKISIDSNFNKLFWIFPEIFRDIYCFKLKNHEEYSNKIISKLSNLQMILSKRKDNWKHYNTRLIENTKFKIPAFQENFSPWRFTFRVQKKFRNYLVDELRKKNFNVSTWYPTLELRYKNNYSFDEVKCPNSYKLTDELINLWIDPSIINSKIIDSTCDCINHIINLKND